MRAESSRYDWIFGFLYFSRFFAIRIHSMMSISAEDHLLVSSVSASSELIVSLMVAGEREGGLKELRFSADGKRGRGGTLTDETRNIDRPWEGMANHQKGGKSRQRGPGEPPESQWVRDSRVCFLCDFRHNCFFSLNFFVTNEQANSENPYRIVRMIRTPYIFLSIWHRFTSFGQTEVTLEMWLR
jgi:hypothetical protein